MSAAMATSGDDGPDSRQRPVAPIDRVPILCSRCGAFVVVTRAPQSESRCFRCWPRLRSDKSAPTVPIDASVLEALTARLAGIRLHWYAGYVSDCWALPDEDTKAVMLNPQSGSVSVHAMTGGMHRFEDSGATDDDGCAVYSEMTTVEETEYVPVASARAALPREETFEYTFILSETHRSTGYVTRTAAAASQQPNDHRVVGSAPNLYIEPAGISPGGGRLSALSELTRPAVRASRIVLAAAERPGATASEVWFHLDQGLVDALQMGDVMHVTRTPRGGVGISVMRGEDLFVALGAVSAVPLGRDLAANVRRNRQARGGCLFCGPSSRDPWRHPIQITSGGRVPRRPRGYAITVWYSAWPPPEDVDECVSIMRSGACPPVSLFASTHLLATADALRVRTWSMA